MTHELDPSFAGKGDYQAARYNGGQEVWTAARVEDGTTVNKAGKLKRHLQHGAGFVAKFSKSKEYSK